MIFNAEIKVEVPDEDTFKALVLFAGSSGIKVLNKDDVSSFGTGEKVYIHLCVEDHMIGGLTAKMSHFAVLLQEEINNLTHDLNGLRSFRVAIDSLDYRITMECYKRLLTRVKEFIKNNPWSEFDKMSLFN